jgi:hypothetical protein
MTHQAFLDEIKAILENAESFDLETLAENSTIQSLYWEAQVVTPIETFKRRLLIENYIKEERIIYCEDDGGDGWIIIEKDETSFSLYCWMDSGMELGKDFAESECYSEIFLYDEPLKAMLPFIPPILKKWEELDAKKNQEIDPMDSDSPEEAD